MADGEMVPGGHRTLQGEIAQAGIAVASERRAGEDARARTAAQHADGQRQKSGHRHVVEAAGLSCTDPLFHGDQRTHFKVEIVGIQAVQQPEPLHHPVHMPV